MGGRVKAGPLPSNAADNIVAAVAGEHKSRRASLSLAASSPNSSLDLPIRANNIPVTVAKPSFPMAHQAEEKPFFGLTGGWLTVWITLAAQGRTQEAVQILACLEAKDSNDLYVATQLSEIEESVKYERGHAVSWRDLFFRRKSDQGDTKTLRRLLLGANTQLMQQFGGRNIMITNFVIAQITPSGIQSLRWKFWIIWTVFNAVFLPVTYFLHPETSNRHLEDMDMYYRSNPSVIVTKDVDAVCTARPLKCIENEDAELRRRRTSLAGSVMEVSGNDQKA
ncbi:hypothetical protein AK830_g7562 [Neonectria ditissima]|uniref:Major facilitator superfamily (MFS) profile domain-containing protein n=1 Tax=Neonectria ditissima TaxID=78410 RepID=A0A0P7B9X8_9HYPO|nr:hypothetical protein AK830_g7562 [Neonectria ditissima]